MRKLARRKKAAPVRRRRTVVVKGTDIVKTPVTTPVVYQQGRYRELTRDEIDLLKRTVAKNTDDDQFALFLLVCRRHHVDPFTKEIYCILYKNHATNTYDMVIQMGINGYRGLAARGHKDYGGCDEPEFEMSTRKTPAGKTIPEKATIRLWRKGLEHPIVGVAYWEEFAPADLTTRKAEFWNKMPKHMLAKCAESHAIRRAYPDMSDIYTTEEMSRRDQDYTEGGRQFFVNGQTPSGTVHPDVQREQAKAEQQRILDEKLSHGHLPGTDKAKQAEAVLSRVEEADRRFLEAKKITPPPPEPPKQKAAPAPAPQKEPEQIWPKEPTKKESAPRDFSKCQKMHGTVHSTAVSTTTDKKHQVLNVRVNGFWHRCYRTSLFEHIQGAEGKVIEYYIDDNKAIVGLRRIDVIEFEDDGKTPKALDANREPGTRRTLW